MTNTSFPCCGWDVVDTHNDRQKCPNKKYNCLPLYSGSTDGYYAQSGGHACKCAHARNSENRKYIDGYIWQPNSCRLAEWDAKLFCELLGDRTILLSGDSTMQQTATTLMSMITAGEGTVKK